MSLKLTGENVRIYKKEKTYERDGQQKTFFVYSIGFAQKNGENWTNGYIDCAFKKDDEKKITNKCKIKINNAFPTVNISNGKSYMKWIINDFEVTEEGEKPALDANPDDFMQLDDSMDDVPFL